MEEADGPVIHERPASIVAQPIAMGVLGTIPEQGRVEDPDRVHRPQRTVVSAALQLLAEQVRPSIEDARGEVGEDDELDLDLKDPPRRVARLHVHHGQLVLEGLALVVGVEDVDVRDRRGEILPEQRIEKVDQQVAMVVGPEQGLEDAVDLRIDRAVHTGSVLIGRASTRRASNPVANVGRSTRLPARAAEAQPVVQRKAYRGWMILGTAGA